MADSFEEIALSQSIIRKQWLPPDVALQELIAFEKLFGAGHFLLACHAALPSLLTPELLHSIRLNFLDQQQPYTPWIAEMDFLLSPLCRPVENDLFEVEPMVREALLFKLEEYYGRQHLQNVADFLLQYLHKTHKSKRNAGVTQLIVALSLWAAAPAKCRSMSSCLSQDSCYASASIRRHSPLQPSKRGTTLPPKGLP